MNRLLVFTVITSLAGSSVAFAGETLVQSGARIVKDTPARAVSSAASASLATRGDAILDSQASMWINRVASPAIAAQGEQGIVSKSGLSKHTKVAIYLAIGVGFAASAWTIDRHVQDVTPSSLGTRKD
jgi:hypothetical protein